MIISVVIPSYKPKDYIWECLNSLKKQSFPKKKFEIIIVLNGCCDPYYSEICDFLSKNLSDNNVSLIQTNQGGVSNARNIGIERAKGEYVTFIDDDDEVSVTYLSDLYEIAKLGYVPISNVIAFNDSTRETEPNYLTDCFNKVKHRDYVSIFKVRSFFSCPVGKLLKKDIIGSCRFNPQFKVGEDGLFMFSIANKINFLKAASEDCVYYRRNRTGSAINSQKLLSYNIKNSLRLIIEYTLCFFRDIIHYSVLLYLSRIVAELICMVQAVKISLFNQSVNNKQSDMENINSSKYSFVLINEKEIPWNDIEQCCDATIFKTKDWSEFLVNSQPLKPFVIEILKNNTIYGYFVSYRFIKFGLKIIGSPFEGWTTSYQGLSMKNKISREERVFIYRGLCRFVLKHCVFIQFQDWNLDFEDINSHFKNISVNESYYLDLSSDIESLYRSFKQKSCQYSIKKAQKLGVIVCEPNNLDEFADEYYNELLDVFAKQNLRPTYDAQRVKLMLRCLSPEHRVLLEARHPDTNVVIATIIFVLHNGMAFYWGAASYREYQKLCPNELLMFEAIKQMKVKGVTLLEMEGIRSYKEKYNPVRYSKPKVMMAKYPILISMKNISKKLYYRLKGFKK